MALENIGNGCSISAELLHVIVKCSNARHFQTNSRYLKMALDHHNRKQAVVAEEAMCVPDNLFFCQLNSLRMTQTFRLKK
jgi:hypothetical protein